MPAQTTFLLDESELRARPGAKWHHFADDVLPAWVAEMDYDVAPPIQAAAQRLLDQRAFGYDEGSEQALAEAFADYMRRRFRWDAGPDWVVLVADLVQAQFAAVRAFTEPGQGVVLQTPIYPPFIHAVLETGRRIVEHPLRETPDRFVSDTATLADRFTTDAPLILLCNPHNPTGRVFERDELEAIAEVAVARQLVVVSDEVHADLTYGDAHHIPFATLGPDVAARTITVTSATKAYNIPGLRCGLLHFGSAALHQRFRAVFPERLLGKVSRLGLEATIAAWRDGMPWLEKVMRTLTANRERLSGRLADELPSLGFHTPEATYLAWLDCRRLGLTEPADAFFLRAARVGLNEGEKFGPPGVAHVRLNFATSPVLLDAILDRMVEAVTRIG
jgi:cystathionine beta-lyase